MQCILIINKHSQTKVVKVLWLFTFCVLHALYFSKCCPPENKNVSRLPGDETPCARIPSHLPRRGPPTGRHWWLLSLKLPETSLCTSDLTVEHTVCTQHKETKQRTFIKGSFQATQRLVSSVITKDTRALRVGDEQSRCGLRQ